MVMKSVMRRIKLSDYDDYRIIEIWYLICLLVLDAGDLYLSQLVSNVINCCQK